MKDQTDKSVTTISIQNGTYTDGIEGSFIIIYMIYRHDYNTLLLNSRPKNNKYFNHQNVFSESVLQLVKNINEPLYRILHIRLYNLN